MPSSPKIAAGGGKVWLTEILHERETYTFGCPYGYQRVTSEVAKNLEGEEKDASSMLLPL